ncbi:hypothetical protein [Streptomyces virginiae]|uniref:hypothetical protein n=1 Tax=Streptomyces virginiae TaxID=1961 RepID=UPI0036FEF4F3
MRRRVVRDERHDELFGPDLRLGADGPAPGDGRGRQGRGLVPLDEIAAAELIGDAVGRASR